MISQEEEQEEDDSRVVNRRKRCQEERRYQETCYEMHMEQLDTIRKYHFLRYRMILYVFIFLFLCSWFHHLHEHIVQIQTIHTYLVEQGEPPSCSRHHHHTEDIEGWEWVYDYFFHDRDRTECQEYRMEVSKTDKWWLFPDLLVVTTTTLMDTVVHPFQMICHLFYSLPYFLQSTFYLACTVLIALYIVTRNIEFKWWTHPPLANTQVYTRMIEQC